MQEKERRSKEYIRQMEEEAEDEIEHLKQTYEKQLTDLNEYTHELTAKVRYEKWRKFQSTSLLFSRLVLFANVTMGLLLEWNLVISNERICKEKFTNFVIVRVN